MNMSSDDGNDHVFDGLFPLPAVGTFTPSETGSGICSATLGAAASALVHNNHALAHRVWGVAVTDACESSPVSSPPKSPVFSERDPGAERLWITPAQHAYLACRREEHGIGKEEGLSLPLDQGKGTGTNVIEISDSEADGESESEGEADGGSESEGESESESGGGIAVTTLRFTADAARQTTRFYAEIEKF